MGVVDQASQTVLNIAVGLAVADRELEFIVHVIDADIKGIGIRRQRNPGIVR